MKIKWTDENQVKAGIAGGIEAVVRAINTHINNVDVCKQGCSALWNMTANDKKHWIKATNNKWNEQLRTKWRQEQQEGLML